MSQITKPVILDETGQDIATQVEAVVAAIENLDTFSGNYADLNGLPTLGTASALDVAASGNASSSQVVKGNDTRLTDARPSSDVVQTYNASSQVPISGKGVAEAIDTVVPTKEVTSETGSRVIEITDGADAPLVKCTTAIQGNQDLHGYDKPWVGGSGKNKLPLVLSDIKSANTNGTWSGNSYTHNGVTYTVNTDSDGNIISISTSGIASARSYLFVKLNLVLANGEYKINGYSGGASTTSGISFYFVYDSAQASPVYVRDDNGANVTINNDTITIVINVGNGSDANGKNYYPMIRLATETDTTFSPYSNICPITAYTEGEIEVCGKNLCNPSKVTHPSSQYIWGYKGEGFLFRAGTSYTLSIDIAVASTSIYSVDETTQLAYASSVGRVTYTPTKDTLGVLRFYGATALDFDNAHIQLEIGTSPTTYEPYKGTTHTTTYPSAIYRGSEDVVKGSVSTEKVVIEFDGSSDEDWGVNTPAQDFYIIIPNSKRSTIICNAFKGVAPVRYDSLAVGECAFANVGDMYVNFHATHGDMATWKSYLASNPLQVVYEPNIPTTSSVTPTNLPIKSLFGYNHIESSTGDMVVDYITEEYQPLVDLIEDSGETVAQTATNTDADYEILFSETADNTTRTEGARKSPGLIYNPLKQSLVVGTLKSDTVIGSNATAFGSSVAATAIAAHAEGSGTVASKQASHAEGVGANANGVGSHAEGDHTSANGYASHAEGVSTTAAEHAHAEGNTTTASGQASHAEGNHTTASGQYSHAEGYYANANHKSQHVFGEHNIVDPSTAAATARGTYVEIVGNGTVNTKSNARTLSWDGTETLAKDLNLAGTTSDIILTGTNNTWDGTNTSLKNALGRYILQANVQATCYNTGMVEITVPSGVSADATGNFFNHVPIIQLRYNNAYDNYYVTSYHRQPENGKLILYIRQGTTGLSANKTIYADILWVKIY